MRETVPKRIALPSLAHALRLCARDRPLADRQRGRATLRRLIMRLLECTPHQARLLMKRLETEGFVRWAPSRDPDTEWDHRWYVEPVRRMQPAL